MYFCYVDDAGCTGTLPAANSPIQPIFILSGLIVHETKVASLTKEVMKAKQKFYPNLLPAGSKFMDWIKAEVKGSDVRNYIATGNTRQRKAATGYLDRMRELSRVADARLVGRVWVKGIGDVFNGTSVYGFSMQYILQHFQSFLAAHNSSGVVIADSRNKPKNTAAAHSIFTQKHAATGDRYPNILEMPLFGHSDNHAGVQVCDTICSAILMPMSIETYCKGHITSVHVRAGYERIKTRYAANVKGMQYRYQDRVGKWIGGIVVSDSLSQRATSHLFQTPLAELPPTVEAGAPAMPIITIGQPIASPVPSNPQISSANISTT